MSVAGQSRSWFHRPASNLQILFFHKVCSSCCSVNVDSFETRGRPERGAEAQSVGEPTGEVRRGTQICCYAPGIFLEILHANLYILLFLWRRLSILFLERDILAQYFLLRGGVAPLAFQDGCLWAAIRLEVWNKDGHVRAEEVLWPKTWGG